MVVSDEPLLALLRELGRLNYEFTAVTPATHARVLRRPLIGEPSLRDIFGWNRCFDAGHLSPELCRLLELARAVEPSDNRLRSKFRVASLGGSLFLHSSYPTEQQDCVFFGPDTYRFTRFVREKLPSLAGAKRVIDMGAGSGAAGISVARELPLCTVSLVDVNAAALQLAAINAAYAEVRIELLAGSEMPPNGELVIANPPYMMDSAHRAYRDGGELLGGALALQWVRQALATMAPGGTMLLYTGAAYRDGKAPLIEELVQVCEEEGATLTIEELDPDVFGEELDHAEYARVERIAAVGAVISTAEE